MLPAREMLTTHLLAGSPSSMRMSSMWAGVTIGATAGFILAYQNSAGEMQRQLCCELVSVLRRCFLLVLPSSRYPVHDGKL